MEKHRPSNFTLTILKICNLCYSDVAVIDCQAHQLSCYLYCTDSMEKNYKLCAVRIFVVVFLCTRDVSFTIKPIHQIRIM